VPFFVFLENTATTRGKPSITVEAGHAGTVEPEDVEALARGCLSVMRFFKMLPGQPERIDHPVWIDRVETIAGDRIGIFIPWSGAEPTWPKECR
jgi:predicted deacylase